PASAPSRPSRAPSPRRGPDPTLAAARPRHVRPARRRRAPTPPTAAGLRPPDGRTRMTPARTSRTRTARRSAAVAAAAVLGLGLSACASESGSGSGDASTGEDEPSGSIGIPSGWDEGIAVAHVWEASVGEEGCEGEARAGESGGVFTALAGGEFALVFVSWLPITHEEYVAK